MTSQKQDTRKLYKLSDDTISLVRECLQLALLTGTNIVDHLRSVVVEPDETGKYLVPAPEYVESWNRMITDLQKEAEEKMKETEEEEEKDGLGRIVN